MYPQLDSPKTRSPLKSGRKVLVQDSPKSIAEPGLRRSISGDIPIDKIPKQSPPPPPPPPPEPPHPNNLPQGKPKLMLILSAIELAKKKSRNRSRSENLPKLLTEIDEASLAAIKEPEVVDSKMPTVLVSSPRSSDPKLKIVSPRSSVSSFPTLKSASGIISTKTKLNISSPSHCSSPEIASYIQIPRSPRSPRSPRPEIRPTTRSRVTHSPRQFTLNFPIEPALQRPSPRPESPTRLSTASQPVSRVAPLSPRESGVRVPVNPPTTVPGGTDPDLSSTDRAPAVLPQIPMLRRKRYSNPEDAQRNRKPPTSQQQHNPIRRVSAQTAPSESFRNYDEEEGSVQGETDSDSMNPATGDDGVKQPVKVTVPGGQVAEETNPRPTSALKTPSHTPPRVITPSVGEAPKSPTWSEVVSGNWSKSPAKSNAWRQKSQYANSSSPITSSHIPRRHSFSPLNFVQEGTIFPFTMKSPRKETPVSGTTTTKDPGGGTTGTDELVESTIVEHLGNAPEPEGEPDCKVERKERCSWGSSNYESITTANNTPNLEKTNNNNNNQKYNSDWKVNEDNDYGRRKTVNSNRKTNNTNRKTSNTRKSFDNIYRERKNSDDERKGIPSEEGVPSSHVTNDMNCGSSEPSSLHSSPVDSPRGSPQESPRCVDNRPDWGKDRKRKSWNKRGSLGGKPGRYVSPNIRKPPTSNQFTTVLPGDFPKHRTSSPNFNSKVLPSVLSHLPHGEPSQTLEQKLRPEKPSVPPLSVPVLAVPVAKNSGRPRSPRSIGGAKYEGKLGSWAFMTKNMKSNLSLYLPPLTNSRITISTAKKPQAQPVKGLPNAQSNNERTLRMKRRETYQKLARAQGVPSQTGKMIENETSAQLKSHFDEQARQQRKNEKELQNLQKTSKTEVVTIEKSWHELSKRKRKQFKLTQVNEKKLFDIQLEALEAKHQASLESWKEQNAYLDPETYKEELLTLRKKQLNNNRNRITNRYVKFHASQIDFLEEQYQLEKEKLEKIHFIEKQYEIDRKGTVLRRQLKEMCSLHAQEYRDRILSNRKKLPEKDKRNKQKEKQLEAEVIAAQNDMINFQKAERSALELSLKNDEKKLENVQSCQMTLLKLKHEKALLLQRKKQEKEELETRILFEKLIRCLELGEEDPYETINNQELVDIIMDQIEQELQIELQILELKTNQEMAKIKVNIEETKKREAL